MKIDKAHLLAWIAVMILFICIAIGLAMVWGRVKQGNTKELEDPELIEQDGESWQRDCEGKYQLILWK